MGPKSSLYVRAIGVVVMALTLGCAALQREKKIQEHTATHVFHRSQVDLHAAAEKMLSDDGFRINVPATTLPEVRTEWKAIIDDEQFATSYVRYVVLIKRLAPQHCLVQVVRFTMSTMGMETYHPHSEFKHDGSGSNVNTANYGKGESALPMGPPVYVRDLAYEWKLFNEVEPAAAALVAQSVDREMHL
jgi:hypothetical protein